MTGIDATTAGSRTRHGLADYYLPPEGGTLREALARIAADLEDRALHPEYLPDLLRRLAAGGPEPDGPGAGDVGRPEAAGLLAGGSALRCLPGEGHGLRGEVAGPTEASVVEGWREGACGDRYPTYWGVLRAPGGTILRADERSTPEAAAEALVALLHGLRIRTAGAAEADRG